MTNTASPRRRTDTEIQQRAKEIENTAATEYPEAGEDAVYMLAAEEKWFGWHPDDHATLMGLLGF